MGRRLEVRLVPEARATHRRGRRVDGPGTVAEICRDLEDADRERFHLLHLDAQRRVIAREEVAVGGLSSVATTLREIFKGAMLANSAGIVMVHNHPSGDPEPTAEDRALTARVAGAGEFLGVPLIDHVVVARQGWRSVAAGEAGAGERAEAMVQRAAAGSRAPP